MKIAIAAPVASLDGWNNLYINSFHAVMTKQNAFALNWLSRLTRTVNFPVYSSLSRGSWVGCRTANPSLLLVASCCSYKAKARWTSNFRAAKNLTAVLQDTGPARLPALHLFTASINSFVAWEKKVHMFMYLISRKKFCTINIKVSCIFYTT